MAIDTLTTPERIALRAAVTARLNSAEDADLVGFAADLGLDVRGILADASELPAKHRHMADKGRPYDSSRALIAAEAAAIERRRDGEPHRSRVEPVGLGWAPALNPDRAQIRELGREERNREAQGELGMSDHSVKPSAQKQSGTEFYYPALSISMGTGSYRRLDRIIELDRCDSRAEAVKAARKWLRAQGDRG